MDRLSVGVAFRHAAVCWSWHSCIAESVPGHRQTVDKIFSKITSRCLGSMTPASRSRATPIAAQQLLRLGVGATLIISCNVMSMIFWPTPRRSPTLTTCRTLLKLQDTIYPPAPGQFDASDSIPPYFYFLKTPSCTRLPTEESITTFEVAIRPWSHEDLQTSGNDSWANTIYHNKVG